jgi:hypothetical protein
LFVGGAGHQGAPVTTPEVPEDVVRSAWPEDLRRTGLPDRARDVVPSDVPSSRSEFRADLIRALDVWRAHPALPVMTTAVAALGALASTGSPLAPVAGILSLVFFGWVGAERLWYLRAFTGRRLTVLKALQSALHYWGRFFVLGLLTGLMTLPLFLPAIPAMVNAARETPGDPDYGVGLVVYLAVISLVADFAATFVTPAIVYTSRSSKDAIVIGLTLLRRTWPSTVPYVLLPPLAVLLLTRLSDGPLGWIGAVIYVLASLVNLAAKGATASYYLRVVPLAGPDGATDHTIGWYDERWERPSLG